MPGSSVFPQSLSQQDALDLRNAFPEQLIPAMQGEEKKVGNQEADAGGHYQRGPKAEMNKRTCKPRPNA